MTDEVIVAAVTADELAIPGRTMPISQDLALVYEFQDGRVRRLTAYGLPG